MAAYAVARLRDVRMGANIRAYLAGIDATLTPFGGRFIIHGGPRIELEGSWPEDLIVIAFPDPGAADAWYRSAAYQEILPLRTGASSGDVILVEGVPPDHRADGHPGAPARAKPCLERPDTPPCATTVSIRT